MPYTPSSEESAYALKISRFFFKAIKWLSTSLLSILKVISSALGSSGKNLYSIYQSSSVIVNKAPQAIFDNNS